MKRWAMGLWLLLLACGGKDGTSADYVVLVDISPATDTLWETDTRQFTPTIHLASGQVPQQTEIAWSSSDSTIATVSPSGLVTALRPGSVRIGATVDGVTGSADVVVLEILRNVIIFATESGSLPEVAVIHPDGSGRRLITTDQKGYGGPVISPDGRHIAFSSLRSGQWAIWVMKSDGAGARKLIEHQFDGSPAWSPDGSHIAFRSENSGPFGAYGRIFVMNSDGTDAHQVSPETDPSVYVYDDGPTWSPDGTRIAFSRGGKLYVINADGTGMTPLQNTEGAEYPSWSPDGLRLAFKSLGVGDIYVRNADGSNPVQVTTAPEQEGTPRWSPDSRRLVFNRVINGAFKLFVINADGTGEVPLSTGSSSDYSPSWGLLP